MCITAGRRQETYTLYYINTSQASSVSALPAHCVQNSLSLSLHFTFTVKASASKLSLRARPEQCTAQNFRSKQVCAARKGCIDAAARNIYRREPTRTHIDGATQRTRKKSPTLTFGARLPIEIEKERPLTLPRPRLCPFSYCVEKTFLRLATRRRHLAQPRGFRERLVSVLRWKMLSYVAICVLYIRNMENGPSWPS